MQQLSVSFIIPAYNEELFLPQVLESIKLYMPASFSYEVIVADNGSEDKTVKLAEDSGAKVIVNEAARIGELRNLAVERSKGRVLVFLDADILLTVEWGREFIETYESLLDDPIQVTGSRYGIPSPASWIEKIWFKPLVTQPSRYINSGHLITSKELFERVGGFDTTLETGEDYAFCQSAIQEKADIINNPSLAVVHKGYPKTIYQFIRREMWHGRGDCVSLQRLITSKVAVASLFFVLMHLLAVTGVYLAGYNVISILSLLVIFSMCVSASIFKHDAGTIKKLVITSFLYYLYFASRFLSCVSFLSVRSVKRNEDT